MRTTISPSSPRGVINAPASKSHVQRLLAASLLAHGRSVITNFSQCDDIDAAVRIIQTLGAKIIVSGATLTIISSGLHQPDTELNCNESGLCARMFAPIAALCAEPVTITGTGSLLNRPMDQLVTVLRQFGVTVAAANNTLPFTISGPILGKSASVDASQSSQAITGLMMALPLTNNDSEIKLINTVSKPYLDLTESVLAEFGINIAHDGPEHLWIPGRQSYKPATVFAEGDWSGAAFPLVMGALNGSVTVTGLNIRSNQADKAVLTVLEAVGAHIENTEIACSVTSNSLNAFEFDAVQCPDLFPVLAALAAHCHGTTTIRGVHRLRSKESDRAAVLMQEFSRCGAKITIRDDVMEITGDTVLGGSIDAHNDHRIAMAAAVLAVNSANPITVENAECVHKSYPQFWEDCEQLSTGISYSE